MLSDVLRLVGFLWEAKGRGRQKDFFFKRREKGGGGGAGWEREFKPGCGCGIFVMLLRWKMSRQVVR